jgi:hypothetical protein
MFLFALASAIKITPAILIVPLIAWREWRALCYFTLWTALIVTSLWALSDGWLLIDYVRHVMPSMASGKAALTNKSLESAVKLISQAMHTGISPGPLQNASIALSALVVLFVGWRSRTAGGHDKPDWLKLEWMSLFWLLSCCLAPVSWRHAYAHSLLVACFLLSISSFGLDSFAIATGKVFFVSLAMLPPLLGVLVVLLQSPRAEPVEC